MQQTQGPGEAESRDHRKTGFFAFSEDRRRGLQGRSEKMFCFVSETPEKGWGVSRGHLHHHLLAPLGGAN